MKCIKEIVAVLWVICGFQWLCLATAYIQFLVGKGLISDGPNSWGELVFVLREQVWFSKAQYDQSPCIFFCIGAVLCFMRAMHLLEKHWAPKDDEPTTPTNNRYYNGLKQRSDMEAVGDSCARSMA